MFCPTCGTRVAEDGAFCHNCGTQVPPSAVRRGATDDARIPLRRRRAPRRRLLIVALTLVVVGVAVLSALGVLIVRPFGNGSCEGTGQPLTQFVEQARAGQVEQVEVDGQAICYAVIGDDSVYRTEMEPGDSVRQILQDAGIAPEDWPPFKFR